VALLTTVRFWEGGAGSRARVDALVRALAERVALRVVLPLALSRADEEAVRALAVPLAGVHSLGLPPRGRRADALSAFAAFFAAFPQQACVFEYLATDWMRAAVPPGVLTLIDTHDVASEVEAQLAAHGQLQGREPIDAAQERRRLAAFDRVIAICEPDRQTFARWLGPERVLVVPHPVTAMPMPLPARDRARQLLFVASSWPTNVLALRAFVAGPWHALAAHGLELVVAGEVGAASGLAPVPGVRMLGRVPDLGPVYLEADIVINPVLLGSGIKIKTLEALAHGRPLVASRHAVRGLPEQDAGRSFVVADGDEAFTAAVSALANDPARRAGLAASAVAMVTRHFSPQQALAPLLQLLGVERG
jgi:hypothetical protein